MDSGWVGALSGSIVSSSGCMEDILRPMSGCSKEHYCPYIGIKSTVGS